MTLISKKIEFTCHPFSVERLDLKDGPHPYYRLISADWVTVAAITKEKKLVLVEQFRAGAFEHTLEAPGGIVDPGEDPMIAIQRELEEETGYVSQIWQPLYSINPNPALNNNRIHLFLAKECYLNDPRQRFPDAAEEINVHLIDWAKVQEEVFAGRINHALSALCFLSAKTVLGTDL